MRRVAGRRSTGSSGGWTQLPLREPPSDEPAAAPPPPAAGEWIDALVADLAIELGDADRTGIHQAAVRELWRRSGLPEGAFAKALLAMRGQAKRWRGQRAAAAAGDSSAKMGAFFLLLRDRLGLMDATDPPRRRRSRVGDG